VVRNEDKLIAAALRLYPNWWRERYLDEVEVVTEDLAAAGRSRWALILNLVIGALRARLRADGMPMAYDLWARRTSTVVALATLPGIVTLALFAASRRQFSQPSPPLPNSTATLAAVKSYEAAERAWSHSQFTSGVGNLALTLSILLLFVMMFWVYSALRIGVLERRHANRKPLRMLARAPRYLIVLTIGLWVAAALPPVHTTSFRSNLRVGNTFHAWGPLNGHPLLATVLDDAGLAALLLCVVSIVLFLVETARHGNITLQGLALGVSNTHIIAVLLWLLTASAATMSALYGTQIVSDAYLVAYPTARSLALLASLLGMLAVTATIGTASARRSLRNCRVAFQLTCSFGDH